MAITFVKKPGTPAQPVASAPRSLNLLSVKDAAAYGKVSTQTVRRLIKAGKLKTYRVAGRSGSTRPISSPTSRPKSWSGDGSLVRGDHHDGDSRGDAMDCNARQCLIPDQAWRRRSERRCRG
jgi:excisionase family DNA binding protein